MSADLSEYVTRVAAILGDTPGADPDTRQRANVLARRVIDELQPELSRVVTEDSAIRALVALYASAASGEPVEQVLKSLDASQSQVEVV